MAVRPFTVDTAAPIVGMAAGAGDAGGIVGVPIAVFSGSADDQTSALTRVEASVDGAAWTTAGVHCTGCGTSATTWTYASPTPLGDGSHTFGFRAVDAAGWPSESVARTLTVDLSPPTLAVTAGPDAGAMVVEATPVFSGSGADGVSSVSRIEASVDGAPWANAGFSCTIGSGHKGSAWCLRSLAVRIRRLSACRRLKDAASCSGKRYQR